ncbi:MAG TPA: hypothetical protein DCS31_07410 [Candidatus Competibacteraceae bacterium]|nr:hypothetical protein [Candidatus Competibacteraceae bacterium]HRC70882.1 hypothetical protein [Candidatus Competibacter denitrificans]
MIEKTCTNCGGQLYESEPIDPRGDGFNLLPGLSKLFSPAQLTAVICSQCGLVSFFASATALQRLEGNYAWRKIE